jgi:hypothetical protein
MFGFIQMKKGNTRLLLKELPKMAAMGSKGCLYGCTDRAARFMMPASRSIGVVTIGLNP